jgi:hypothetical protein
MSTSPNVAQIAAFELQACACEGMVSNLRAAAQQLYPNTKAPSGDGNYLRGYGLLTLTSLLPMSRTTGVELEHFRFVVRRNGHATFHDA